MVARRADDPFGQAGRGHQLLGVTYQIEGGLMRPMVAAEERSRRAYTFDFGDGTVVGPQSGATAQHTYQSAGTFTVKVTVTDIANLSSSATSQVSVANPVGTNLVGNPGFESGDHTRRT